MLVGQVDDARNDGGYGMMQMTMIHESVDAQIILIRSYKDDALVHEHEMMVRTTKP